MARNRIQHRTSPTLNSHCPHIAATLIPHIAPYRLTLPRHCPVLLRIAPHCPHIAPTLLRIARHRPTSPDIAIVSLLLSSFGSLGWFIGVVQLGGALGWFIGLGNGGEVRC